MYNTIKDMNLEDLKEFFNKNIKGQDYNVLVIGNKKDANMKALSKLGKVEELDIDYLFNYEKSNEDLKLLSYNVRQFNRYNWIESDSITRKLIHFIESENADIVCLQEYYDREDVKFNSFKENFKVFVSSKYRFGQAILTNLPVVNKGSIGFEDSNNNAIYADVVVNKDTIRVFNIHLESLKIAPRVTELQEENSEKLVTRMGNSFTKQQAQVNLILKNIKECPYKTVISGDMNNSAFSFVYRKLAQGRLDAFKEKGKSFGKTFDFDFIPLRIDAILVDEAMQVKKFTNYTSIKYSDHYPISCTFSVEENEN